jgi:MFS family permease
MPPKSLSANGLIAVMFTATLLGMVGIVAYPALMPTFKAAWGLSNTSAGWIGGVYFAGYAASVPILSALTDKIDARRIILFGLLISAIAPIGFSLTASGLVSASLWWGLQGVGFAGIYMPGLKALNERVPAKLRDHAAAVFTATFTVGVSISFSLTGDLANAFGWRSTFMILAIGPVIGAVIIALCVKPKSPVAQTQPRPIFDFKPVFQNRRALAHSIAYAVHNGESAVMRAWIVALLVFAASRQPHLNFNFDFAPTTIATLMTLSGLPAILLASRLTKHVNRRWVIVVIMVLSAITGIALALSVQQAFVVVFCIAIFYGFIVTADSGIINAGLLARAEPARHGASMAVHAMLAFTAAFLMPFLFGAILDVAGGETSPQAWLCAFGSMAVFIAMGPLALFLMDRD